MCTSDECDDAAKLCEAPEVVIDERCSCGSSAINPHLHGRDPNKHLHLCDVCYWRELAREASDKVWELHSIAGHLPSGHWCWSLAWDDVTGEEIGPRLYPDACEICKRVHRSGGLNEIGERS